MDKFKATGMLHCLKPIVFKRITQQESMYNKQQGTKFSSLPIHE